jgi:small subunit ribosomal protein S1
VIKLDPEHKKVALSIKEYLIEKRQEDRDDIVVKSKAKKGKKKKEELEDAGE